MTVSAIIGCFRYKFCWITTKMKLFRRVFDGSMWFPSNFDGFFTEETNTVHRFLSAFPFSWLLVNLRAYEVFVLPSCFAEEHPLDIRIYYLVWHLHLLHCWDIVEPFGTTSKNVFRSISRSFRSIGRSFRSISRSFRSSRRSFRSVLYVSFQLKASFNSVRITLFFNCWYAPTIIKNLTRKCKISKCFCKSTPLLLKNNYLFVN